MIRINELSSAIVLKIKITTQIHDEQISNFFNKNRLWLCACMTLLHPPHPPPGPHRTRVAGSNRASAFKVYAQMVHVTCVCVCVCVLVTQLCLTLCNPMDCNSLGSSVHGILQARILEWVTILQGIFPTQGSNLGLPHCRQILYRLSDKGNVTYTHILLDRGGCMVKAKVNRIRGILHKGKNDKGEVGGGNRWFEHVTQFSTGGVRSVSY